MKKQILSDSAQKLYVEKFLTLKNIAGQLKVSERTLRRWKSAENWDVKRKEYLKTNTTLHQDLYNFAKDLLDSIKTDMKNGDHIEPSRMYTITKILKMLKNPKLYEEKAPNTQTQNSQKSKNLSPEVIREIEENILGITYED